MKALRLCTLLILFIIVVSTPSCSKKDEENNNINNNGILSWQLLIPGSNIPSIGFNIKPFGFDRDKQIIYSVYSDGSTNRFQKFDLVSRTVTPIPASGWFGRLDEFAYDMENNRIIASRSGRDVVYAIPVTGGTWTQIGDGSNDSESYGGMYFWNKITNRPSFFGGYGLYKVRNWIWENDGSGWINTRSDLSDCLPPKRPGTTLQAANADFTKYYIFSGYGNCDGSQLATSCALGSPWATSLGQYCWLRDLWELDLSTYQFTNILPINSQSIAREGTLSFDYLQNTFYIIGGIIPTATDGVFGPATMDVQRFRRGIDSGFQTVQVSGTLPPIGSGYSIFDEKGRRIIHARQDGIWALNLGY